jgi:hypothetical protein
MECSNVVLSSQGDTLITMNCEDTIEINFSNIERKGRLTEQASKALQNGTKFIRGQYSESYLVNRNTDEVLTGFYKIIYSENEYSIGYYYNGRPFPPYIYKQIVNKMEHYKNGKLVSVHLYENGHLYNPPIFEFVSEINGKHTYTTTHFYWDVGIKAVTYKYVIVQRNNSVINKKTKYYHNDDSKFWYGNVYDPCRLSPYWEKIKVFEQ